MSVKLSFLGATEEVTGSSYLIETPTTRFLVDCGMFQGGREADTKNRAPFRFDPQALDFVLLTHAHIDHSGLLPRLTAGGFNGPIYTTAATIDLLRVMLLDSAYIQEKEQEWRRRARKKHYDQGNHDAPPLYTAREVEHCLTRLRAVNYDEIFTPHPGIRCRYRDAGHILGAASVEVWLDNEHKKIVFSGDIGPPEQLLLHAPAHVEDADVLLIESTYGNRLHKSLTETRKEIAHAITDTLTHKRGNVIVPAFAVGRAQTILYLLADLHHEGRLPEMQIYVDSPLATQATEITLKHHALLNAQAYAQLKTLLERHGGTRVMFVEDLEASRALNDIREGAIILSASGMCDAGRVKHHLLHNLGRRECSVIITGFQAQGTLGRHIVDRAAEVRIYGERVPVRADIYTIGGLSAHADQTGLLDWMRHFKRAPAQTFVVHGERDIAHAFRTAIATQLGWTATVPAPHATVEI